MSRSVLDEIIEDPPSIKMAVEILAYEIDCLRDRISDLEERLDD